MGLSHRQVFLQSSPSPLKLPEADIEQSSLENNLKRQRKVSQMMGDHHLLEDACPKRDEKKAGQMPSPALLEETALLDGGNHGRPGVAPMGPETVLM